MDGVAISQFLDDASAYGLLVVFAILLLTDRLVTGKRLRDEKAEKREYADIVKSYGATLEKLLAGTETTNQLLRSLPHPTDKDGERT